MKFNLTCAKATIGECLFRVATAKMLSVTASRR